MRPQRRIRRGAVPALVAALVVGAAPGPVAAQPPGDWWQQQWRMDEVWRLADGAGVTVAVIDTGVDPSVPELAGALVAGADFVDPDSSETVDYDQTGHGTAMAVHVAGRDADRGVRGAAPAAMIMPIAFPIGEFEQQEEGEWHSVDPSEMIRWAVDNGADIINLSFAFSDVSDCASYASGFLHALENDVLLVTSAGNVGPNDPGAAPASCPGVLTVGGNGPSLEPWEGSVASEYVDVSAPSVHLDSTFPDRIGTSSGTSIASALVSGVAALLRSEFPEASAEEIAGRIIATARDVHSPGWDPQTGHGVVRPYEALTATDVPGDTPNPVTEALRQRPYDDLVSSAQLEQYRDNTPPPLPEPPAPQAHDGSSQTNTLLVTLLVVGALLLVVVAALIVMLFRGRRNARRLTD